MKIFSLHKHQNKYDVLVFDSLQDFTSRTEWQDVLGDYFKIIDEKGNIYKWDNSKKNEYATVYNYTLKIENVDILLGNLCMEYYQLNNYKVEFEFYT